MTACRSRLQLDISGVRAAEELDIELNMRREILYLRSLRIHVLTFREYIF